MAENGETEHPLSVIIEDTTEHLFDMAGGFGFTDEVALGLNARWRKQEHGPVLVSAVDLAWLLDGYARARIAGDAEFGRLRHWSEAEHDAECANPGCPGYEFHRVVRP